MARETAEKQIKKSGPGAKPSKPSMRDNLFVPTRMNPQLYMMTYILHSLPDPDVIMANGDLHYQDLANLEHDGHISSCTQQRKSTTLAHRIRIRPGEGASGLDSEKALLLCRRMLDNFGQNTQDLISQILDARLMGMQPFELNWYWDEEVKGLITERPQDTMQEWFRYTPNGELRFRPKPWVFDTEPVPPFKILMARNQATMRNPYGKKLYSACYWPSTFKRGGMKFFAEYTEKFGMPIFNVEAPAGTNVDQLQEFVRELIAMARQGVVVTKGNFKVQMDDMKTKFQTTDMYDKFMASMDRECSKAILGQTLTSDEGGSRAQADVHKQILETLWKSDDTFAAGVLTDLFDLVTYANFGRSVIGPVAIVGESMGLDRIDRDSKLRDLLGVNFTDTYIMDHYDLSAKDFVRSAPLKPLSPMDPSLDISELGPDGAPTATATADLKPGFLASTSSAGAKPSPEPKDGPSRVSPKDGGARKSEAAKNTHEARANHRNRGDKK
jgi:hypothetical protein